MLDHTPVAIDSFGGLWARGMPDSCPSNHFLDCKNVVYQQDGVATRPGSSLSHSKSNIRRFYTYKRIGETSRLLLLADNSIYDSTDLNSPILTISGMTDFSYLNFNNRAFISPHDGTQGLPGAVVYVYNGSGSARAAACSKPTGSLAATTSAQDGNVEAGTRLFVVSFETDSGYLSKPGPALYTVYDGPGGKKVDLSSVPTGPAGTVRRRILSTVSTGEYDGNQNSMEFFFVPNGVINDNSTTTITLDFFDADLLSSADYLFDQLESIPAGLTIASYKGRMVVGGEDGNEYVVRLSRMGEPESFDAVEGFMTIDPTEAGGVNAVVEYRSQLMIHKSNRVYVTTDNLQEPAYWEWVVLDKGAGTECHGISTILDASGTSTDVYLIADRSGLLIFDGKFNRPELSWKIEDIWKRINPTYFRKIQISNDPVSHRIYVAVPLDAATENSHLLVCEYPDGLGYMAVKWSIWEFPWAPVSISIDVSPNTTPVFRLASSAAVYLSTGIADYGQAIDSYVKSALVGANMVNHIGAVRLRVRGNGSLESSLSSEDGTKTQILYAQPLALNPDKDPVLLANFVNEKASLKLRTHLFGEYFQLKRITIYTRQYWMDAPRV